MSTGFQVSRNVGQFAASRGFLAGKEYVERCRPSRFVEHDLRGTSTLSEYFERIFERDHRSLAPEVGDADPAVEALDLLLVLQPGWDGRRAPAPSHDAIRLGRQVLELGRLQGLLEARVTPDVEGGLAVYFFGGDRHNDGGWNRKGAIMVSNEDEATVYLRDRSQPCAEIEDIATDVGGLRQAIVRIRQFVNGS